MASSLHTRLTELLDITIPVVSAPMAMQGTLLNIALAVQKAGGFGFIALGYDGLLMLKSNLQNIRSTLQVSANSPVPIGVGFIAWVLDKDPQDVLTAVLDERPQAVWFAFSNDLGKYVHRVREYDEKNGSNTLVFLMVNQVEDAVKAVVEWKTDVLVLQGSEAGGHLSASAPPLSMLLAAVLAALPKNTSVPILAAGGIHTGAQLASYLTLGASGCVLGTRLLFTPDSSYPSSKIDALLAAGGLRDTAITPALDEVRGTLGWPAGIEGRAIRNDIIKDKEEGLELEERKRRFTSGEGDRQVIFAGMGVALTKEVKSTGDVVKEIHEDAIRAIQTTARLVR